MKILCTYCRRNIDMSALSSADHNFKIGENDFLETSYRGACPNCGNNSVHSYYYFIDKFVSWKEKVEYSCLKQSDLIGAGISKNYLYVFSQKLTDLELMEICKKFFQKFKGNCFFLIKEDLFLCKEYVKTVKGSFSILKNQYFNYVDGLEIPCILAENIILNYFKDKELYSTYPTYVDNFIQFNGE